MKRTIRLAGACALLGMAAAAPAAHDHHDAHGAVATAATGVRLVDVPLVDQNGRTLHLASEAIGDHLVVVDFIYTRCTTVCPILSTLFEQVQRELGEQAGREVRLLSISVDPQTDTPERLKELAGRHRAGPGWTFLTGERLDVEQALLGLGAWAPDPREHPLMVLVGDGRSGTWTRFDGLPSAHELLAGVEALRPGHLRTDGAH